jgi:hypothetical protein
MSLETPQHPHKLPTVNALSLELVRISNAFNVIAEGIAAAFGISIEVFTYEDQLKLGMYHTRIKITKVNGVKTDG